MPRSLKNINANIRRLIGINAANIIKEIICINDLSNIWYSLIFSSVIDAICILNNRLPIVALKGDIVKIVKYKKSLIELSPMITYKSSS